MSYHLKLAIRNLLKQRVGSFINIVGLSVGLAICLIIALFIQYELSFDKYNKNYASIHRLLQIDEEGKFPDHPVIFNKILEDNIPELQNSAILYFYNKTTDFFKLENKDFIFNDVMFTNQNFFNIFTVNFLEGTPTDALDAPNKVVLTQSTAHKIFGDQSAIGKTLNYENKYHFTVSGIIEDLPPTSHFKIDLLASIDAQKTLDPNMMGTWWNSSSSFYYKLPAGTNIKALEEKIEAIYLKEKPKELMESTFQFQPLSKIHLYSGDISWDSAIKGDIQIVWAFIIIALLILSIACFNYINLSLALSAKQNFQVALQKTLGASKKAIFISTLSETCLLVLICALGSIILSFLLAPGFNQIMGTDLIFTFSNPILSVALISLIIFTVLVSSIYQSWQRIRLKPIAVLGKKSALTVFGKQVSSSKAFQSLTIAQLAISMILIVGVISVYKQTNLMLKQQLGFNKSQLISIKNPWDNNVHKRFNRFKEELSKLPNVKSVSGTWNVPGEYINNYSHVELADTENKASVSFGQLPVEIDFFKTIEPSFLYGRDFDAAKSSDSTKVIINKTGMEQLGLTNPIGTKLRNGFNGNKNTLEITGVIDNIQYRSLKEKGKAAIYYLSNLGLTKILVRLNPGDPRENIGQLRESWNSVESGIPFEYEFVDQKIQANYEKDIRTRSLLSIMAFLAIGISMFGIFGLAVFLIQTRTKEIGIRKVNGAKVSEILILLNKDFVKWVIIAFVIACPIAYYAMSRWLENFAYKTSLSWWIFALAGVLALGIALLTVSWQSWRAATRNPVEALRHE